MSSTTTMEPYANLTELNATSSFIDLGFAGTVLPFANNSTAINCANDSRTDDLIRNGAIQSVFCFLYSTIFVLGVFGNALVCYVVFRNKAMQTVTNLFITNLALSDILLCTLAVPFTPLYTFLGKWIFGLAFCRIVPYAQGCSVYISTLTLTSIAIDRFFVIIYPFHPRMKLSTCIGIILCIWLFSLLVTFPYGLNMRITIQNDTKYCEENWTTEDERRLFSSITSTLQFGLPFLIIAFCYICVSIRLNDRAKSKPGNKTTKREEADRDRKKRTNRMLISMVAIFGISWMPLNLVNVINDFHQDSNCWRYYNFIFFLTHLVAMSSTCYNPFLYAWLNENFRKEFKQVLPCFSGMQSRGNSVGGTRAWRSERATCNGNNDTVQESLLPSGGSKTPLQEIQPRGAIQEAGMRASLRLSSGAKSSDTILLSDVMPPTSSSSVPAVQTQETVVLPSGVLETPFEEAPTTTHNGELLTPRDANALHRVL